MSVPASTLQYTSSDWAPAQLHAACQVVYSPKDKQIKLENLLLSDKDKNG